MALRDGCVVRSCTYGGGGAAAAAAAGAAGGGGAAAAGGNWSQPLSLEDLRDSLDDLPLGPVRVRFRAGELRAPSPDSMRHATRHFSHNMAPATRALAECGRLGIRVVGLDPGLCNVACSALLAPVRGQHERYRLVSTSLSRASLRNAGGALPDQNRRAASGRLPAAAAHTLQASFTPARSTSDAIAAGRRCGVDAQFSSAASNAAFDSMIHSWEARVRQQLVVQRYVTRTLRLVDVVSPGKHTVVRVGDSGKKRPGVKGMGPGVPQNQVANEFSHRTTTRVVSEYNTTKLDLQTGTLVSSLVCRRLQPASRVIRERTGRLRRGAADAPVSRQPFLDVIRSVKFVSVTGAIVDRDAQAGGVISVAGAVAFTRHVTRVGELRHLIQYRRVRPVDRNARARRRQRRRRRR